MNSDEVLEIKRTWEIPMGKPTESGVAILDLFFEKYPSQLEKFYAFKDVPKGELSENARYKAHATRIIRIFDDSIQQLGHDCEREKLEEIWSKIATSHFNRKIEKDSFTDLKGVILEVLSDVCPLNEEQAAAWSKLIDNVYVIIFKTLDKLKEAEQ